MPSDRVTSSTPQKMLALRVDSCPICILPSFNKALVTTSNSGIVELDITGESPQLRPPVLLHGHQTSVNCVDTFPQGQGKFYYLNLIREFICCCCFCCLLAFFLLSLVLFVILLFLLLLYVLILNI